MDLGWYQRSGQGRSLVHLPNVLEECFIVVNHPVLIELRRYGCPGRAAPRMPGRARGTPCTYQSLTKIRSGLSFHANRSYRLRNMDAPRAAVLYNTITEVLRFAVTKYSIPLYGNINTTHVGLSEIAQLIDLDMGNTRCFAVAEMHHLAWCIYRFLAPPTFSHHPSCFSPSPLLATTFLVTLLDNPTFQTSSFAKYNRAFMPTTCQLLNAIIGIIAGMQG